MSETAAASSSEMQKLSEKLDTSSITPKPEGAAASAGAGAGATGGGEDEPEVSEGIYYKTSIKSNC